MRYLPVFLKIRRRPVLVVGGGTVAARKAETVLRAGGQAFVVAPKLCTALDRLARAGRIRHAARSFQANDIQGCSLVIAATDDAPLNRRVYTLAESAGVPVNVVDCPELCTFIMPAIIDRSPLQIAISTGGTAPVLARQLRAHIETMIPAGYGRLAAFAGSLRDRVKDRLNGGVSRRRFWEDVFDGPVSERVLAGEEDAARDLFERMLDDAAECPAGAGEVYLVGAGCGDPDLLTFRAMRLMQKADVVLYDRLVAPKILDMVRRDAECIDVGKRARCHTKPQKEVNRLMVELAQAGRRVLRLKGGDPFLFGRGGEELEFLVRHGVPFQVVPGITAATGCAAYAGIPLTHRDHAQSCVFVTGHMRDGRMDLDWPALARPRQTVVAYMGLRSAPKIARNLIDHGAEPDRPVAIVEDGTRDSQRLTVTTLVRLPDAARGIRSGAPTLLIIGEVVRLASDLSWFVPSAEPAPGSAAITATG